MEVPTRLCIIGLGLGFCLPQAVEIEPGLPRERGGRSEIEVARAPSSTVLNGLTPARRTMLVSCKWRGECT
jgi:hypothetical protein